MPTPWTIKTLPRANTEVDPPWTEAVYYDFEALLAAARALQTQKNTLHIGISSPASATDEERKQVAALGYYPT